MRIYASAAYVSLVLFITQIEHPSHARQIDKGPAIEFNLNINLNGISNGTNGIEVLNEPEESLTSSRSAAGNDRT